MNRFVTPARRLVPAMLLTFAFLYSQAACSAHALDASGGGYTVTLVDAWGRELPSYRHQGATYIRGDVGERYAVRIKNNSAERVEVVVSVDGRDVLTGDPGNYRTQRGYVVAPWQTVTVDGFRKNMNEVASFRFTSPGNSYSSRRGTPQNVGVVGVAVFREQYRQPPVRPQPVARPQQGWLDDHDGWDSPRRGEAESKADEYAEAPRSTSSPSGDSGAVGHGRARDAAPAKRNNIGTEYGETRASGVVEVPFVRARANNPERLLGLYYDDVRGLEARGIRVYPAVTGEPNPFPGERRFAPPPR